MKISKVIGENFKGHENIVLDLGSQKTQIFLGKNGVGKSSAIEMIKYAITGDLPNDPVNKKYNYMNVETILDSGTSYLRGREEGKVSKSKIKVNGKNTTGKMLNDLLETETGIPNNTMKIVSSQEVVEKMKPDEFSDFLMSYTPEELNIDLLLSFTGPLKADVEKQLRNLIPPMPAEFSVDVIKNAYEEACESRKSTKAVIDELKSKLKIFNGEIPTRTMNEVDAELEDVIKLESSFLEHKKALKIYEEAEKNLRRQEEEIKNLKEQIDAIRISRPLASTEKELKDAEKNALSDLVNNEALLNSLEKNKKLYVELLRNLSCTTCPICSDITCTTDKSSYSEAIQENLDATIEGIELAKSKVEKSKEKLNDVRKKIKEFSDNVQLYNKKVSLIQQLDKLQTLKIVLPIKPEQEDDGSDYTEKKETLKKERKNIFECEQHLKIQAELEVHTRFLETYKELANLLSPKGIIMDKIIDYYVSYFEDICNLFANDLKTGFEVRLKVENGIRVYAITPKCSSLIPYENLSSGEKSCVLFLILHMLNSLSGLKILIMDDLDKLDSESFASMIELIMRPEIQDAYDHIILSSVNHSDIVSEIKKYPAIKVIDFELEES